MQHPDCYRIGQWEKFAGKCRCPHSRQVGSGDRFPAEGIHHSHLQGPIHRHGLDIPRIHRRAKPVVEHVHRIQEPRRQGIHVGQVRLYNLVVAIGRCGELEGAVCGRRGGGEDLSGKCGVHQPQREVGHRGVRGGHHPPGYHQVATEDGETDLRSEHPRGIGGTDCGRVIPGVGGRAGNQPR